MAEGSSRDVVSWPGFRGSFRDELAVCGGPIFSIKTMDAAACFELLVRSLRDIGMRNRLQIHTAQRMNRGGATGELALDGRLGYRV